MIHFLEPLRHYVWFGPTLISLFIWELCWKLITFWKAARRNHLVWFICIGIINTVGILPIIYLLIYRNTPEMHETKE
ncbi:DUF5652 family protein [Microbacter margulisiae]|uniref:DUF5652 domain-containing protein n=1 Tax=Microbacter margulisiae TaxID=1350067 RepID=A0A7W5DQ95_9PORP|nr:DUF5652 family protein [Microbacter margulisiae]MBB3187064.1 hypothetical protein [Microbacter margulisiae]